MGDTLDRRMFSMNLEKVFSRLRPSIVAFGSKAVLTKDGKPPTLPGILGTGFVVRPDGIVVTNRHVAEVLEKLPRHPKTNQSAAFALVFTEIRKEREGLGMGAHMIEIDSFHLLTSFSSPDDYYGNGVPDLAFVQLGVTDLPAVKLASYDWSVRVGMEIATAGFPMGEDPLVVNGALAQGTPLLRRGIVSGVSPFPCPQPHGFVIDVMSQGGASGSPIFRTDKPEVNGILYAGFPQSNITYAFPASFISFALAIYLQKHHQPLAGLPSFRELKAPDETKTSFEPHEWDAV